MTMFQGYCSSSGTFSAKVTKPNSPSYSNSTSPESTVILCGLVYEYAPNGPQPQTFMITVATGFSVSYFNPLIAPPELNILVRPIGANLDPLDNAIMGTMVKISYSRGFNVIDTNAFLGR